MEGRPRVAVASGGTRRSWAAESTSSSTPARRPEEAVEDADLVVDVVGGPTSGRFLRTLRRGGALFPLYLAEYDPEEVAARGVVTSATQVRASGAQMAQLAELFDQGVLRVAIESTFPLAAAAKAHERAAEGHLQGKVVLTVDDGS